MMKIGSKFFALIISKLKDVHSCTIIVRTPTSKHEQSFDRSAIVKQIIESFMNVPRGYSPPVLVYFRN